MMLFVNGIRSGSAARSYSETETKRCNLIGPTDVSASAGPAPRGYLERKIVVHVVQAIGREIIENMERETGIEPATSSLGSWHSTAELLPLIKIRCTKLIPRNSQMLISVIPPLLSTRYRLFR